MSAEADRQADEMSAARGLGRVATGLSVVLAALLWPLLAQRSQNPWLAGYSKSYCVVIALHLAALAAGVWTWRRAQRAGGSPESAALGRSFGLWVLGALWAVALLGALWIYLASGDRDFRHLSFLLFSLGALGFYAACARPAEARPALMGLAVSSLTVLLMLALAELVLLFLPWISPGLKAFRQQQIKLYAYDQAAQQGQQFYQSILTTDPELGYKQRPDAQWQAPGDDPSKAGQSMVTTDAWGFFNEDLDPQVPYDVVMVGDSFSAVHWPGMVARLSGLRVATLGVPAYCPPQYTLTLERYGLKLHPKVVFYNLFMNDATETATFDDWRHQDKDWFTFKGGLWFGPLPVHKGRRLLKVTLVRFSRLYSLLQYIQFQRSQRVAGAQTQLLAYHQGDLNLTFDAGSYQVMTDLKNEQVRRGLELMRTELARAKEACSQAGARLIVLLLPPKELVYLEPLRQVAPAGAPLENLRRYYDALQALCRDLDIEVHDYTPAFTQAAAQGQAFYYDKDIHWNDAGNRLAAGLTARWLHEAGYSPVPQPAP